METMPHLVAAPDKFNRIASANVVALAIERAATAAGWTGQKLPVSNGGEGILDVFGGKPRRARVHGPLGGSLVAEWRLDGTTAVVEMARASGLALVGGPEGNDPVRADTTGTGELVAAAVTAGARHVIIGMGGSASTDGGLAAVRVLEPQSRLRGVELTVACDVPTLFLDAATTFAAEKGATPSVVTLLSRRLERLAQVYQEENGVDVRQLVGGGAAGGLAGGLAALGANVMRGFDVLAEAVELAFYVEEADLVVTGERFLDEQSFHFQAVGGVCDLARQVGTPVLVIAEEAVVAEEAVEVTALPPHISLVERFGAERVQLDPMGCVQEAVAEALASFG
jgi:glycerate kinase